MEQEQEARAALEDVRRKQTSVEGELSRRRPRWWMDLLYAVGIYTVLAGIELGPMLALPMAGLGFAMLFLAVWLGIVRAARGPVRGPRRVWTPARAVGAVAWIAAMFAVMAAARAVAEGFVPEWAAPMLGAIPAAVVAWFFVRWLGRIGFGPRRSGTEAR